MKYPSGKKFAFTILDDTDDSTLENVKPVYDLLSSLGFRTTKTVWAIDCPEDRRGPYYEGETLASSEYLEWTKSLEQSGFEIAMHNATMGSSERDATLQAFAVLDREFQRPVRLGCNHGQNKENLHWGRDRYSSAIIRQFMKLAAMNNSEMHYYGADSTSEFYWADIAAERLDYMRAFSFTSLNCDKVPPGGPYIDEHKGARPALFNSADAPELAHFNGLVTKKSLTDLMHAGGWTIVSTHLGKGFCREGKIDKQFQENMEFLSNLPGWYVPASTLLDYIAEQYGLREMRTVTRAKMEWSHIWDRLLTRISQRKIKPYWHESSEQ